MHYKNGRAAQNGDPVITKNYDQKVVTGTIHNLRSGATCNCDVAVIIPGGIQQLTCQSVNTMFHAEDGLFALQREKPTAEHLAGIIYEVYCQEVGGKAFNGDPLPDWKTFSSDPAKEKQAKAWIKAAEVAQALY